MAGGPREPPRRLAVSTPQGFQGALRAFLEYLTDERYPWAAIYERELGRRPAQVIDERNRIAHVTDFVGQPARQPLSRQELMTFFEFCDAQVHSRRALGRKGRWPRSRAAAACYPRSTPTGPSRGATRTRSAPTSTCASSAGCWPTTRDLRDRVAGCLLLVFAQPVTRLARLTSPTSTTTPARFSCGSGPSRSSCPNRSARSSPRSKQQPRHHLPTGPAALLHLAQTLPPAILADLLNISEGRAADRTRAATGDWARYAAEARGS